MRNSSEPLLIEGIQIEEPDCDSFPATAGRCDPDPRDLKLYCQVVGLIARRVVVSILTIYFLTIEQPQVPRTQAESPTPRSGEVRSLARHERREGRGEYSRFTPPGPRLRILLDSCLRGLGHDPRSGRGIKISILKAIISTPLSNARSYIYTYTVQPQPLSPSSQRLKTRLQKRRAPLVPPVRCMYKLHTWTSRRTSPKSPKP
jgi:hypothetical protein